MTPPASGPDRIEPELLDRYLAGECSELEVAVVRRYLMAHPAFSRALSAFLRQLDGEEDRPPAPSAEASWEEVRGRMATSFPPVRALHGGGAAVGERRIALLGRRRAPAWQIAIGACAAAGLLAVGIHRHVARPSAPAVATPPDEMFVTANRERAELRLSDGTRIKLAPASRLRVAATYGERKRDVYLEGQAYFEVEHDAARPFTVHAGNTIARDIGTGFAVRSYPEDEGVQVVVRTGAVVLAQVGRLKAGDVGRVATNGATSLMHGVRVDSVLGWLDGKLVFHDAPLSSVLHELERWHGESVQLSDESVASLPFTGVLTDASFRVSIDLVAATLGLRVRRVDGKYVLDPIRGVTPPASPDVHRVTRTP